MHRRIIMSVSTCVGAADAANTPHAAQDPPGPLAASSSTPAGVQHKGVADGFEGGLGAKSIPRQKQRALPSARAAAPPRPTPAFLRRIAHVHHFTTAASYSIPNMELSLKGTIHISFLLSLSPSFITF